MSPGFIRIVVIKQRIPWNIYFVKCAIYLKSPTRYQRLDNSFENSFEFFLACWYAGKESSYLTPSPTPPVVIGLEACIIARAKAAQVVKAAYIH